MNQYASYIMMYCIQIMSKVSAFWGSECLTGLSWSKSLVTAGSQNGWTSRNFQNAVLCSFSNFVSGKEPDEALLLMTDNFTCHREVVYMRKSWCSQIFCHIDRPTDVVLLYDPVANENRICTVQLVRHFLGSFAKAYPVEYLVISWQYITIFNGITEIMKCTVLFLCCRDWHHFPHV